MTKLMKVNLNIMLGNLLKYEDERKQNERLKKIVNEDEFDV